MLKSKMSMILPFLVASSAAILSDTVLCEEMCIREISPAHKQEMLIGYGEGENYADGKMAAIADAISVLGTKVTAKAGMVESSDPGNPQAIWTIESESEAVVKGAKVLSHCQENKTKIIVGIPKTTIFKLIDQRSLERMAWIDSISTGPKILTQKEIRANKTLLENHQSTEKNDLDTWIVLGRPSVTFKSMPPDRINVLAAMLKGTSPTSGDKIIVSAKGTLAQKTLPLLINRLTSEGISAESTDSDSAVKWECVQTLGSLIGSVQRFQAHCILQEYTGNFDPITVNGMSPVGAAEDTAADMISKELLAH